MLRLVKRIALVLAAAAGTLAAAAPAHAIWLDNHNQALVGEQD